MASSRLTAVRARSPPDSIDSGWRFLPGGRAWISTPVAERSSGAVRRARRRRPEELLEAPRERVLERGERARNWSVMSALSDGDQLARVELIADSRSTRCASMRVEALAELGVLLGRERVAGAELVEAAAQRADSICAGRLGRVRHFSGFCRAPGLDHQREFFLVGVGLAHGDAEQDQQVRRPEGQAEVCAIPPPHSTAPLPRSTHSVPLLPS